MIDITRGGVPMTRDLPRAIMFNAFSADTSHEGDVVDACDGALRFAVIAHRTHDHLCDSDNSVMESIFGPNLFCSIHYCHACKQSFEHFKAVYRANRSNDNRTTATAQKFSNNANISASTDHDNLETRISPNNDSQDDNHIWLFLT